MPFAVIALLGVVGAGLALLLWRVSTLQTDPEGYTKIGDLGDGEIDSALRTLRAAGIPTITDDHLTRGRVLNGPRDHGVVRLLVPRDRAEEAVRLLRADSASYTDAPPA